MPKKSAIDAAFRLAWAMGYSAREHELIGNGTRTLRQKTKVRFLQLLLTEPVAWAWEHYNTTTGEVVKTGLSATRVEPTKHAYMANDAGTQWIGTRVTPLRA